jgi:hypothetical protein
VLVEMVYVTITAGTYAGLQQRALGLHSRWLSNGIVALGVPTLAQVLDWLTHRALGAVAPGNATAAVCMFTLVSACFHLHVMRRGAFLTGDAGRTLADDFRRMPGLIGGIALRPFVLLAGFNVRLSHRSESEGAL